MDWQTLELERQRRRTLYGRVFQAQALAARYAEEEEASSSRRRRDPNAPPKKIRQRDHAMGDARIRADYFGDNPVYSETSKSDKKYIKLQWKITC